MEPVEVIIEKGTDNYSAFLPLMQGCIATGESIPELKLNIEKAIAMHLKGMEEDGDQIPSVFCRNYRIAYVFDVETFLNYYSKVFSKRALSKITGVNESLLSQYASGLKKPREKQAKRIEESIHRLGNELLQIQF